MPTAQTLNTLTVDLEEWYHGLTSTNPLVERWPTYPQRLVAATTLLVELLERHRVRTTFFVLGDAAIQHPGLVRQLHEGGHEIALHGHDHRRVDTLTPRTFETELERGIRAIEDATGVTPRGHRAPYFSIGAANLWALDVLRELGFAYDSSVFPARSLLYGYPEARRGPQRLRGIAEVPVSTLSVAGRRLPFGGGFYTRMLPYPLLRWGIHRLHREGLPAVLYVHPWELDAKQPHIRVTPREQITHYSGRGSLAGKLDRLLGEFRFTTLREVVVAAAITG